MNDPLLTVKQIFRQRQWHLRLVSKHSPDPQVPSSFGLWRQALALILLMTDNPTSTLQL
jgi:hypothetical protein